LLAETVPGSVQKTAPVVAGVRPPAGDLKSKGFTEEQLRGVKSR
jgi:hypothetical protein